MTKRTTTKELTVILEAYPEEEGSFSVVSVNGMTPEECWKPKVEYDVFTKEEILKAIEDGVYREAEIPVLPYVPLQESKPREERLTDEQALLGLWSNAGTDIFWPSDELPDMKGKPYIKLVGHVWFEEYDSIECGTDYDSGFEIESDELLDAV